MNPQELWLTANQNLIAKSIGELSYEQILKPVLEKSEIDSVHDRGNYRLELESGVSYTFRAWCGIWEHLRVEPNSIQRLWDGKETAASEAGQFFIDARAEHGMTDIVLGNFLEEMQSTLYSDMTILKTTASLTVTDLVAMNGTELQTVLNGHPKILLNKGRMGWGATDLALYAPECAPPFQLHWLALTKQASISGFQKGVSITDLYETSLSRSELENFRAALEREGKNPSDSFFIPIHPWQWDRIVRIQFAGEIARGEMISLGPAGDFYRPQISLRTLSNVSRPEQPDVKLPLSILNTSAMRGLPARYLASVPQVSEALSGICKSDPFLLAAGTEVLEEKAGIGFRHPLYSQVHGAPYRYHETLGVIWRDSVPSKLSDDELGILTGCLFHQDSEGRSLIGAYIRKSGLEPKHWLKLYFDAVVIPLYHLQLKYGLGLVAHGQNIVLKLKNFAPHGMLLKDFQGDLRISSEHPREHSFSGMAAVLDKLLPEHLIHDLITGHFLTVLRFISEVLQESEGFHENKFYLILSECVRHYLRAQAGGETEVEDRVNLLNEKFHRVLLNKTRFQIGYADSAERPRPLLGADLPNPLAFLVAQNG